MSLQKTSNHLERVSKTDNPAEICTNALLLPTGKLTQCHHAFESTTINVTVCRMYPDAPTMGDAPCMAMTAIVSCPLFPHLLYAGQDKIHW